MNKLFDNYALTYDAHFTNTTIGRMQRKRVWKHLNKLLNTHTSFDILEINCGTGEDAIFMAEAGHQVTATDNSMEMIGVAKEKAKQYAIKKGPVFIQCSFEELADQFKDRRFDLVFSDFGGINCISAQELEKLRDDIGNLLKPGALCMMVVMGNACVWENFYFLIKGKWKTAFRRKNKKGVDVVVGEEMMKTWYYSPSKVKKLFVGKFDLIKTKPIGIYIPPSYLQPFFNNKKGLLKFLNFLESIFGRISLFSNLADHYCIQFSRKGGK